MYGNSLNELEKIPDKSIKLVITDPPHGDRMPYLELSEIWNSILNKTADFSDEIVISNAKERGKNKKEYNNSMRKILFESERILRDDGFLLLYFNARDKQSWSFLEAKDSITDFVYIGAFPMNYSANSVVQDNRKGAMKTDYILVMKHRNAPDVLSDLKNIPGWTENIPCISGVNND